MADNVKKLPGDVSHLQRLIGNHAADRRMPPARLQRWLNAMIVAAVLDQVGGLALAIIGAFFATSHVPIVAPTPTGPPSRRPGTETTAALVTTIARFPIVAVPNTVVRLR